MYYPCYRTKYLWGREKFADKQRGGRTYGAKKRDMSRPKKSLQFLF